MFQSMLLSYCAANQGKSSGNSLSEAQASFATNTGIVNEAENTMQTFAKLLTAYDAIAQFAITINSNVCPHIRVLNTLMGESYA